MTSQNEVIYQHLKKGHTLTPKEARILFECDRLGARIHDLRSPLKKWKANILTTIIKVGKSKRVAEYRMV